MQDISALVTRAFEEQSLTYGVLSNPRQKDESGFTKVTVKPVMLKQGLHYQFTNVYRTKTTHENFAPAEAAARCEALFADMFRQGVLHTNEADYHVLTSKKGKVTILKKPATRPQAEAEHNRKKRYLLEEGVPVPFLIRLGVMNAEGKVLAAKYDKFRQVNRFLEMVADVMPGLRKDGPLTIVDFGSGKSYLTFALYHYLTEMEGREVDVVGLDLKADVVAYCNQVAGDLNYKSLRFEVGDIKQYTGLSRVDMVVTLHACDTATDAALAQAVRWKADVILSVPCCQHELNGQIENEMLTPLLKYGVLKERFAALATDAVRAQLLSIVGYKTQILEFIDLEHTPKNLLIRAVREPKQGNVDQLVTEYRAMKESLHIDPSLERMLGDLAVLAEG